MVQLSFEAKDRAEKTSNPAESTAEGRARATGSEAPQDKAGHKADDTPFTARLDFVQPGKTGPGLPAIDLEVLYAVLGRSGPLCRRWHRNCYQ